MGTQAEADALRDALLKVPGVTAAAVDLAKKDAKVTGAPGYPTAQVLVEACKAAGVTSSEKKMSGGLHKFDASEVDVNGGDATADDLMDAFGF